MTPTTYPHIVLKESGTPMIEGTRISVARIALDFTEHRYRPEEIPDHYDGLTLAQVFAALAYYFDHKDAMDRMIQEDDREFLRRRAEAWATDSERLSKLKAKTPAS